MSVVQITGLTATKLFRESLFKMRVYGMEEESRNGKVDTVYAPVVLRLLEPQSRVLTDPTRDANPFFHAMEFVWMMAGCNDIQWIAKFNKNMLKYSDDGITQNAAYGHRWREHFSIDQVKLLIELIKKNPLDRRLVINMWDPWDDLGSMSVDVPCNTQLLFRVVEGELQMTVINRSNDLIWGALGANLCHMTMLQELIAKACNLVVGTYYVFTQNLHIYHSVPNFDYYIKGHPDDRDIYTSGEVKTQVSLLQLGETYDQFVEDCGRLVKYGAQLVPSTYWMKHVGQPIYSAWHSRSRANLDDILADDWRIACSEWVERRKNTPLGNQLRDDNAGLVGGKQAPEGVGAGSVQSGPVAGVDPERTDLGLAPIEPHFDGSLRS